MEPRGLLVVKPVALSGGFAEAIAFQVEAVRVVDEAVEDRVGERRIGDDLVPMFDGDLAGDDRRSATVTVVDDLKEIASLLGRERREPPVVEDQQIAASDALQAC